MDPQLPQPPDPAACRAEAVRRLYHSFEGEALWVPLLPGALVAGLWLYVEHTWLLAWLAAAIAVPTWRYWLVRRYKAESPAPGQAGRWVRRLTQTTAIDGVLWGVAGWAFFVPDALPPQLVLLAMIVGIPAGSIFTNSWWPASLYAYAVPSLLLTAAGLAAQGSPSHLAMAGGLLVYLAILYQVMRQAHTAAMETIGLRFENVGLIQQLRHEKAAAEAANIAKSKFLAAASHDLRQPLHALGLFVATLDDRIANPKQRATMDNINSCVASLNGLFDALLDISKLDAGVVTPQVRDIPLAPLIERLAAEYAPQARAKGLTWHAPVSEAVVRTDPLLFERILRNLLSNALRYTEHGRVQLECTLLADKVIVEVSDTGIGIPPEHQHEVFREFVQLHNPERDRRKGIGLGLTIVQRLSRLLEHPLEMQSQPDAGTLFRLTLPAGDDGAAQEGHGETQTATVAPAENPVLIIDDEADVREAMKALLEGWGYATVEAADGDEALALLGARTPLVIIADYRLREDRTGVQAIRSVQEHFAADIPALLVTGDTSAERIRQGEESGITLLHKPVAPAKLRAFLRGARPA